MMFEKINMSGHVITLVFTWKRIIQYASYPR